ncbi:MAG: hypothetical protein H8F28_20380 [Fibrella sp.]|nr:hypothetical protein [Armatimonadota bacterium]
MLEKNRVSLNSVLAGAVLLIALLAISLSGCGGSTRDDDRLASKSTFRGMFTDGFEKAAFRPCGSDESYWVAGNTQPIYALILPNGVPVSPAPVTEVYVEVEGTLSPRGEFGHLGMYERELTVDQVLSARTVSPDACR